MCLYTEQTEPKTAKHNIFVWKEISNQEGSEYCLGVYGDIVASKMIVFRTWWNYIKWRLFR